MFEGGSMTALNKVYRRRKVENKLKPCPFCGSDNLHYFKPCHFGATGVWSSVHCCNCGADMTKKDDKAIAAWNRRYK